ncbi:hypothetical protein [Solibacillus sp. FSL H8-0538]|uniref:hypothetical protein n=1 Tax=Solibacillus sp. FSL H8-0538 TaxID=2921400 RepID=UPI0030FAEA29
MSADYFFFNTLLQNNIAEVDRSEAGIPELQQTPSQIAGSGSVTPEQMTAGLSHLQDPTLKDSILSSVNEITKVAAQIGYGGMFYSAVIIAICIVVMTLFLQPIRKKSLPK